MSRYARRTGNAPRSSDAERIRRLLVIRPPPLPAIRIARNGWHTHSAIPRRARPLRTNRRLCWRSFQLFRLLGVPVQIHSSTLVYPLGTLFALALFSGATSSRPGALWLHPLVALLLSGVFLGSLLIHEFAHVLAARRCGIGTEKVLFLPVGAVALLRDPMRDTREFWIAAAGPLASAALAGCCWLAEDWLWGFKVHQPLLGIAAMAAEAGCAFNVFVALFNLIPCFPMDGGRILRSLLAVVIGAFSRAEKPRVFELASRIVVRFTNPLVATGVVAFTISVSHLWANLVLFPLLIVAGEFEHRALWDDDDDDLDDEASIPRTPRRLDDA